MGRIEKAQKLCGYKQAGSEQEANGVMYPKKLAVSQNMCHEALRI
jgi:hypothetical protein